MITLGIE